MPCCILSCSYLAIADSLLSTSYAIVQTLLSISHHDPSHPDRPAFWSSSPCSSGVFFWSVLSMPLWRWPVDASLPIRPREVCPAGMVISLAFTPKHAHARPVGLSLAVSRRLAGVALQPIRPLAATTDDGHVPIYHNVSIHAHFPYASIKACRHMSHSTYAMPIPCQTSGLPLHAPHTITTGGNCLGGWAVHHRTLIVWDRMTYMPSGHVYDC